MTTVSKIAIIEQKVKRWTTPPVCQGQMVVVEYGDDHAGGAYRRITDKSDGSTSYEVAEMTDCGCANECDCWDPANAEPGKFDWQPA